MKLDRMKPIIVELDPPWNGDLEKITKTSLYLKERGISAVTFADSPGGIPRTDSVLTAVKIQQKTGMKVIPHICCRDKNKVAFRSQILGAYANDLRNFLFITGDGVPKEDRPNVKPVFHCNSISLMEMVKEMNETVFEHEPLIYGGALNYDKAGIALESKRIQEKIKQGASFFLTQPFYTEVDAKIVEAVAKEAHAKVFCGIMPLVSRKNALYVKEHIRGIRIPEDILEAFSDDMTKEEGEAKGIALAKQALSYVNDFAAGYYFMFPFNRVYLLDLLLED